MPGRYIFSVLHRICIVALCLSLFGCGSEPPVAKKAITPAPETSTPAPTTGGAAAPATTGQPQANTHLLETGETFEHKLTLTADKLEGTFTKLAMFDSHSKPTAEQIKQTVAQMKALKVGQNLGGEFHSDTARGHEALKVLVQRTSEKEFSLIVVTPTKELNEQVKTVLK